MNKICFLLSIIFMSSCVDNDSPDIIFDESEILSDILENTIFVKDAIIACAASDNENLSQVNVYYYPEEGATNIRLYETKFRNANGQDFSNYQYIETEPVPFFGGVMGVFNVRSIQDWFVVVYEVDDIIKISTPIRSKINSQRSLWTDDVDINQQEVGMPLFSWDIYSEENNAIFFEVLSTENLDFISGTYTQENKFQYYKLDNVVLNATKGTPPELVIGNNYIFTVMDVSIDNWVNQVIMTPFIAE